MEPPVIRMHTDNGLIRELKDTYELLPNVYQVDRLLNDWLNAQGMDKEHIPFAGSGVLHFDRQYIKKYLPEFNKRVTFWA
jgi:oligoribonuclease (3'-5' exoribonuclease)